LLDKMLSVATEYLNGEGKIAINGLVFTDRKFKWPYVGLSETERVGDSFRGHFPGRRL
jgi:hypothetical protein